MQIQLCVASRFVSGCIIRILLMGAPIIRLNIVEKTVGMHDTVLRLSLHSKRGQSQQALSLRGGSRVIIPKQVAGIQSTTDEMHHTFETYEGPLPEGGQPMKPASPSAGLYRTL